MTSSTLFFVSYCLLIVLVVSWSENSFGSAKNTFITWEDLTIGQSGKKVIVVDKNGSGDSLTVQGAVNMVPDNNSQRVKIHILPGVYSEKVNVPITKPFISFIGDPNQPSSTVRTWHDKESDSNGQGGILGTFDTASVKIASDYFCASGITFENSVVTTTIEVDGYQAVSLRISGNNAMFYKVRVLGSQDTLLDEFGMHYYYQCFIQGTVDFIFGYARSLYQECTISVVDGYAIAAQGKDEENQVSGFSFVNCTVTGTGQPFLGRAWKPYSKVVYSYCNFDIDVLPEGWSDFRHPNFHETVFFGEYNNGGRGKNRGGRVQWSKALADEEAKQFLDRSYINGDTWLRL